MLVQVSNHTYIAQEMGSERQRQPRRLGKFEAQVFSQSGEDGILQEIFRRVGKEKQTFVEFGAGTGEINNTTLLLQMGWTGVWLEGDAAKCARISREFAGPIHKGSLKVRQAFLTAENVTSELRAAGVEEEVDLLSIDVDGNDYWIWKELAWLMPRVVIIEYNAVYPPPIRWVMPYDPVHQWRGDTWFGASLKSIEDLGESLGYALVGCTLAGTNAFLVRRDLLKDSFAAPYTAENHYEPARYFLTRRVGHPRHTFSRSLSSLTDP